MKQSNRNRPCLQWAQANLIPEEVIARVPLPTALQGHKRLRGHYVQGPLPPTIAQRVESGYLGRYAVLRPVEAEKEDTGSNGGTPEEASQAPHCCGSLVEEVHVHDWLQQCVAFGEWEDPFITDDQLEYKTCCFEQDFTYILDKVTATDEVDLIIACEDWGQRVDKALRNEGRTPDPVPARHMEPSRHQEKTKGKARAISMVPPLMEPWEHPLRRVRQKQQEDEKESPVRGVQGPRVADPRVGVRMAHLTFFILHLFSGHSREGDMDWWARKLTASTPYQVVTIPFDIVHHKDKGDLTNETTFKMLLDLLRLGRILGLQAGPPCETWSCARHQAVADGGKAPRPLRSANKLWGEEGLTKREQWQVEIGNLLYQRTWVKIPKII